MIDITSSHSRIIRVEGGPRGPRPQHTTSDWQEEKERESNPLSFHAARGLRACVRAKRGALPLPGGGRERGCSELARSRRSGRRVMGER